MIHVNPEYAFVQFKDGRESTVSIRDIAPIPQSNEHGMSGDISPAEANDDAIGVADGSATASEEPIEMPLRRSGRERKSPLRLDL